MATIFGGAMNVPHALAVDSKGNVYVGENFDGRRFQRFVYKGMGAPTRQDASFSETITRNDARSPQGDSTMIRTRILAVAALATALMGSHAVAQQPPRQPPGTQRVSGTIERVDGTTIYGKGTDGSVITLKLADNVAITTVLKATVADIRPGDYVGTGAVPQADGSHKAVELRIFPRPQDHGGHFYEGWPGAPNGTMTNGFVQPVGTVGAMLAGAGEPSIMVRYPQGEKRIVIPANAHVVRNVIGSKDDLKPGAVFRANVATKQPDGTFTASAVIVGRDGARPF